MTYMYRYKLNSVSQPVTFAALQKFILCTSYLSRFREVTSKNVGTGQQGGGGIWSCIVRVVIRVERSSVSSTGSAE